MSAVGSPIEAVLTLNATGFHSGLNDALESVKSFVGQINSSEKSLKAFGTAVGTIGTNLLDASNDIARFNREAGNMRNFNTFANGVKALATAIVTLGENASTSAVGMQRVIRIIESIQGGVGNAVISVQGLASALREMNEATQRNAQRTADNLKQAQQDIMGMVQPIRKVEEQTKMMEEEFNKARSDLMNFANTGISEFHGLDTSVNELRASLRLVDSAIAEQKARFSSMSNATKEGRQNLALYHQNLKALALGVELYNSIEAKSDATLQKKINTTQKAIAVQERYLTLQNNYRNPFEGWTTSAQRFNTAIERNSIEMQKNGAEKLRNMGYTGKLSVEEEKLAMSEEKQSVATDRATTSMDRQTTATNRLRKAMSSLRMIGTMVASMMVWNFAHNLITATRETVNAKSEMEGYFKMLGYSSGQVDHFNSKLDEMIQKFPRINKYNLGETISSIGVEFELTTQEMEKAMPVVSMITSEYLRAGRNVNEASLAVKDILQGEFQRLSRETGVKGDQLKEAGWSGDKTDVMGLLEALDKVGRSRNWDTFVMKANSLNDAVLILQNRFGEWSADMVNVVQPTILSVFNNLMSFGQGLSESLTATWEWLNGGSWEASATQIGLFGGALLTVSQALVQYRTGMGLAQTSQLGLRKQLASLILGLKGQEIAEIGVRNAILGKILGVKAETVATKGVTSAIRESYMAQKISTIQEQYNTMATGENTLAKKISSLYTKIDKAETEGLITAKEKETLQEELNTASKELGTIATIEQTGANSGLTASLYLLGTGEMYVAGETTATATAMGVLNGVIALSPVGWFIGVVMALAGAFYVLSGGLDSSWKKMQKFHDAMEDPASVMEKQYDRLDRLKNKVGETSDKYTKAKDSVDDFYTNLQSAKAQYDKSEEDFESIGTGVDTNIKDVLERNGITESDAKKFVAGYGYLSYGKRKYYEADQVLNKQIYDTDSNFAKDYEDIVKKMDVNSDEFKDMSDKMVGNYENLAEHSYIANTTDDWWEWMWNSLYAGMDQFWIDWDKFWLDPQWGDAIDGIFHGLDSRFGLTPILEELGLDLNDKSIGEIITGWFGDVGKFFEGKSLMDLLGLDENKDYIGDFAKWLGNEIGSFDWVGAITSSLTGINVIGAILDAILPAPASASDGSSDHPSFMEDLSNIIGFDVQTWITNFNSDPLGTLGIQLPPIDIMGLISPLIPTVENGGFDIGGWLSSLFNIDGIVATFTTNLQTIFSVASSVSSSVGSVFSNLRSIIWGHISNIITNVTNGFNTVKDNAVSKINQLKDGVSGAINKVKSAFITMKDSILNSAKLIYDGVKEKFDGVKNTIGDFWNKLTNPSSWGSAGSESYQRRSPKPQTARRMFSPVVRSATHHGAGINPYQNDSQTVRLKDLMDMVNGDNKVRLSDFLAMFSSGGFGAWNFHEPSKTRIFDTAKNYKTGSPNIRGIGTVGDGYYVSKFWDGKPKFSFDEFLAVAQAIFSAIPYKFYYDSEWKGNWVNALLSGATNCYDGSMALLSLARVFGFGGNLVHTNLKNGVGHFYVNIAGRNLDTTNFQNHGSWSPLGGAGIPTRTASYRGNAGETQGKTVNITVSMDNAVIYGVDDLDSRIQDSVQKGIQSEFNDPYTVAI